MIAPGTLVIKKSWPEYTSAATYYAADGWVDADPVKPGDQPVKPPCPNCAEHHGSKPCKSVLRRTQGLRKLPGRR